MKLTFAHGFRWFGKPDKPVSFKKYAGWQRDRSVVEHAAIEKATVGLAVI